MQSMNYVMKEASQFLISHQGKVEDEFQYLANVIASEVFIDSTDLFQVKQSVFANDGLFIYLSENIEQVVLGDHVVMGKLNLLTVDYILQRFKIQLDFTV